MQDRRATPEQPQYEHRGWELGFFDFGRIAKGLLDSQMGRCHPATVEPRRDLADEVECRVVVERLGELLERAPGLGRRVAGGGVQSLCTLPVDVGRRAANRGE